MEIVSLYEEQHIRTHINCNEPNRFSNIKQTKKQHQMSTEKIKNEMKRTFKREAKALLLLDVT